MFMAGRGAGKTNSAAHYVDRYARHHAKARIAIVFPTLGDARQIGVHGVSGLLTVNPSIRFVQSPDAVLHWPNGATARLFGAHAPDDPNRLRGPEFDLAWCDELASWVRLEETWEQLEFVLRRALPGSRPHAIITTTPPPRPRIRQLVKDPGVPILRASTGDNPHLPDDTRALLQDRYGGTAFGRQELDGELVEDDTDIVVPWGWLDRVRHQPRPPVADAKHPLPDVDASWRHRAQTYPTGSLTPVELGVDVGAGGDESVIVERRGPLVCRMWTDQQPDTMRLVGRVLEAIRETGATMVKVDVIGIGKGVVDRLTELGRDHAHAARIIGVNVGANSSMPARYPLLRDELWWDIARTATEEQSWDLSGITDTMAEQLSAPRFTLDSRGRVKVEPKATTRAQLGRSPDHADALLLAFHQPRAASAARTYDD